jgi:predicted RND superfamily exporter protein
MSENNNKSLYIYTGLIFLVAVILIIVSFFGQSKLEKTQPISISQEEANSITERAAVLSRDNKTLLEENIVLKQELSDEQQSSVALKSQIEIYKKSNENNKLLLSANGYCSKKMYAEAREVLEKVDASILSDDETLIYNNVKKAVENAAN